MVLIKYALFSLSFVFLLSCSSKREFASITTFAFDHGRSGTYHARFSRSDLKNLSVQKHGWAQNALKHMPLYLRFKDNFKDIIIFGTKQGSLNAYDLKNETFFWKVPLGGELTSTPVYSEDKKTIFLLILKNINGREIYEAVSVSINGKVTDRKPIKLIQLFKENGVNLKENEIIYLRSKTAIGLNEINSDHYIFFGFSSAKNPYVLPVELANKYGVNRGATGLMLGLYINSKGKFSKKAPLMFQTSSITHNSSTGFDTGVYNAGGAAALLNDNTILFGTGNGPNFPEQNNFGCSIVRLDGQSFKPKGGSRGSSYLTRGLKGYHECHMSNIGEFTSSWPSFIETQNDGAIGFSMDKYGDVHIFKSNSLAGNKEYGRIKLRSKEFFKSSTLKTYSNGSIFKINKKINLIIHHNSSVDRHKFREIYATKAAETYLLKAGYKPTQCLGLLQKKGDQKKAINLYFSGDLFESSALAIKDESNFLELNNLLEFKENHPEIKGLAIEEQKIPLKDIATVGYEVDASLLDGYNLSRANLYGLYAKDTSHFMTYITKLDDFKPRSPNIGYVKFDNSGFDYFKKTTSNLLTCPKFDKSKFTELMAYEKEPIELVKGLQIHSLDISDPSNVDINWIYKGGEYEQVEKNAIVTVLKKDKGGGITLFNVTENNSLKSSIRILDTFSGELIKDYPISDKLHFSSLILTDYGIFAPTVDQGIIQLAFPD